MFQLKEFKRKSKKIKDFEKKEWGITNKDHFQQGLNWKWQNLNFQAIENGEIRGILILKSNLGVVYIDDLLVAHNYQGQGVGTKLIKKAEEYAAQIKAHKIFLYTGKTWESVKFYKALGYKIEAEMPNHYGNQDWVIFSKYP